MKSKQKQGFIELCMRYYHLMLTAVIAFVGLGIYGLWVMPKQEFPTVQIGQGLIVAVYPGATPLQIEEQVAKPLEEFVFTYKEVKKRKTTSTASDGLLIMQVELNGDVENKSEVWNKIKHGLTTLKPELPQGVLALRAMDDFGDTSALLITLESQDKTYRELEGYLGELEGRLRGIESVSNLRRYGLQKEQISIYLDHDKVVSYGLNLNQLRLQLYTEGLTTGGAHIKSEEQKLPIYVSSAYSNELEIANHIIQSDAQGNVVRIKDVAEVVREYPQASSYIKNNGKRAIVLSMEMRDGYNIVEYGAEVDKVLRAYEEELPESVRMQRIADQPKVVGDSVASFLKDLVLAIVIVVGVMLLLFSLRSAIVAGISIPVSIAISIAIMYFTGIPLNTVTLAALIVVLGMIVDNSIIVIDAYQEFLDKGYSRWHATIKSAKDYFAPIFLATACICIIFFPLLWMMEGTSKDFLNHFPWTLTISLGLSLVLAMVFIPFVQYLIIKPSKIKELADDKRESFSLLAWVQQGYERLLSWVFRHPWLSLAGAVVSVVLSFVGMSFVDIRMMPRADRDQLAIELYLPQGTALARTSAIVDSVYQVLDADERISSMATFVGMSSPRFHSSYAPQPAGEHYAQFIVRTTSEQATMEVLEEYSRQLMNRYPEAYVKLKQLDYSPTASPIELRLVGNDLTQLRRYADSVMMFMREQEEFTRVRTDQDGLLPALGVKLDPVLSSQMGISKAMVSTNLDRAYGDMSVGTIWEGNYPVNVALKSKHSEVNAFDAVQDEYITPLMGSPIQLRQIAEVKPEWHIGKVVHRNGLRTLTVQADVSWGVSDAKAQSKLESFVESGFASSLPPNISWEYGGTREADQESGGPMAKGLMISILLIYIFLVINFRKLKLSLVALSASLLSFPGMVLGLLLFGVDFGTTCVLGLVSLLGMIVRNAILIFEHSEDLVAKGWIARDAAFDAGRRRMIPIFLTSMTTAVGVVPMIISGSSLWMPMGVVIFIGTIVSLFFIVTILPIMYWKLCR